MKITQIMLSKGFGGAERYFVDLSLAIADLGHEVQAICHKKFKELDHLKLHSGIELDTFTVRGWWDVISQACIQKALAKFNPDIVHAHLNRGAYIAGKACRKLQKPLVVKTHNYIDLKYYKHVDKFITPTIDQKDFLVKNFINPDDIFVIPYFSSFNPVQKARREQNRILKIVTYGRLVKKKGFHILLAAFKIFLDTGHTAILHIGGDGPEKPELVNTCQRLGLTDNVKFDGWINDAYTFAEGADIFVLPSLDEPFGIVILEAMAMGIPLIATLTKGPLEILDDNTAYLVEPGNINNIAEKLCIAADDYYGRSKKASLALEKFNTVYARNKIVPRILDVYQKTAGLS
jgi:glycosyltransferase involved in cell wall biosynthesis